MASSSCIRGKKRNLSSARADAAEIAADIEIMEDMYTSVVLAAFGSITIKLGPRDDDFAKMHPFFLLIACVPLFLIQISTLMALRLDVDWMVEVGKMGHPNVLFPVKVLMIFTVQLMTFGYLVNSLQLLVFVCNPITWIEIEHPTAQHWVPKTLQKTKMGQTVASVVNSIWFHPWTITSLVLKFVVGYIVCIDARSIILQSGSVQDAVINSVATIFIAELSEPYWHFLCSGFHLAVHNEGDVHFVLDSGVWTKQSRSLEDDSATCRERGISLSQRGKNRTCMPGCVEKAAKYLPFMTRAGGAGTMEDLAPFFAIFALYVRECFVVAHAFDSAVLPSVRDVCTMWRWQNNKGSCGFIQPAFSVFIDYLSLVGIRNKTELIETKMALNSTAPCEQGGKFFALQYSDYSKLIHKYPFHLGISITLILFVLLGHRIICFVRWACNLRARRTEGK